MAKIINGFSWSSRTLIFAICLLASHLPNGNGENYDIRPTILPDDSSAAAIGLNTDFDLTSDEFIYDDRLRVQIQPSHSFELFNDLNDPALRIPPQCLPPATVATDDSVTHAARTTLTPSLPPHSTGSFDDLTDDATTLKYRTTQSLLPHSTEPFDDLTSAATTRMDRSTHLTDPVTRRKRGATTLSDEGLPESMTATRGYCREEIDETHCIYWRRTTAGEDISRPCPVNSYGNCTRICILKDSNAGWSPPNCNSCFDVQFKTLLEQIKQFEVTEMKSPTELADIAGNLSYLTNRGDDLTTGNLNASIMILNGLAVFRRNNNNNSNAKEIKSVVQSISNILQPNTSKAWAELKAINSTVASAILFTAEIYGQSLSKVHKSNYSIEKADFLVLEAWSLDKSKLPHELEFPTRSFSGENGSDRISISLETLSNSISTESTLNIWGLYYQTINNYLPGETHRRDNSTINSRVLSLSIGGLQANEKLMQPVIVTLEHTQVENVSVRRTCNFWNFDSGEWDSSGCWVTSTNVTHTICSCDHLTNFAILMSRNPSPDKALSVISMIGCSISVIALTLTIFIYASTWKKSKSAQATVLLNLCVALIIAYVIFMTGADKFYPSYSQDGCKAVAVLLHYFFLVAFFMMLAEGIELVLHIIFVFHVRHKAETVLLIVSAWVLPLIIVVVSLGITKLKGYGNEWGCWLSTDDGLIWAFIAPVLCIITANFVILVFVLLWMSLKSSTIAKNAKRNEIRATIWNLSVTCPVLGLGWLFGVLSVAFDLPVFQYLFVIANTTQGLFIFIFHALLHNKKLNDKISYISSNYCSCRNSDSSASTQLTSSQEPPKKPGKLVSSVSTQLTSFQEPEKNPEKPDSSVSTQLTSFQKPEKNPEKPDSSVSTQLTSFQNPENPEKPDSSVSTQLTSFQKPEKNPEKPDSSVSTQLTSFQEPEKNAEKLDSSVSTQLTSFQEPEKNHEKLVSSVSTQLTSSQEPPKKPGKLDSSVSTQLTSFQEPAKKPDKHGFVASEVQKIESSLQQDDLHSTDTMITFL